jgi:hypothetical protein
MSELEHIASLCREHDLIAVTDEVYEHLVYEGTHVPLATLPGMRERTVLISSSGKTFSFTGWKVGHTCAPPAITAALRCAHQFVTFCTATPFQHALARAFVADDHFFTDLTAEYRARRDRLCDGLRAIGLDVLTPAGTYFVMTDIRRSASRRRRVLPHAPREDRRRRDPPSSFYVNQHEGQAPGPLGLLQDRRGPRRGPAPPAEAPRLIQRLPPRTCTKGQDHASSGDPERHHVGVPHHQLRAPSARGSPPPRQPARASSCSRRCSPAASPWRPSACSEPEDGPSARFLAEQAAAHGLWICGSVPEAARRRKQTLQHPDPRQPRTASAAPLPQDPPLQLRPRARALRRRRPPTSPSTSRACAAPSSSATTSASPTSSGPRHATDAYIVVANWPERRRLHWTTLLHARAIENQAYVVGVNRVGHGSGLDYSGDSRIIDPWGETLAAAAGAETMLLADLRPELIRDAREKFPVLRDRR